MSISGFDSNISGEVLPESSSLQRAWESFVELDVHGYYLIGRVRRFDRFYFAKAINPDWRDDPTVKRMLLKEFNALARLNHPGIVNMLDYYEDSPIGPCLLMEYVDGQNLKEFLEDNYSTKVKIDIARQLLDAMAFVHSRDIVHRDLKPENILVTLVSNQVKIIDFGLADFPNSAVLKKVGGNDRYSAPEQLSGDTAYTESDVYSLGKLLVDFKLPLYYRYVLKKATAENKNDRYKDASQLLRAMKSAKKRFISVIAVFIAMAIICGVTVAFNSHDDKTSGIAPLESEIIKDSDKSYSIDTIETPSVNDLKQNSAELNEAIPSDASSTASIAPPPTKKAIEKQVVEPLVFSPSWPRSKELTPADTTAFLKAFSDDTDKYIELINKRGNKDEDIAIMRDLWLYYIQPTPVYIVHYPSFKKKFQEIEKRLSDYIIQIQR